MERIFGTLNVRGDTETVLLGGAYLEHELQQVIEAKFPLAKTDAELGKRLFDPYSGGVLNSFGAKIHVARAMEFIGPETYADFKMILDIRNTFAHTLHSISFAHSDIIEDCHKLNVRKYLRVFYKVAHNPPPVDDARHIFLYSLSGFISGLRSIVTKTASIIPIDR